MMKTINFILIVLMLIIAACQDNSSDPYVEESNDLMKAVINKMLTEMDTIDISMDPDYDFAVIMIPYHRASVGLTDLVIARGHHENLILMAKKMKESHTRSITLLTEYRRTRSPIPEIDSSYMKQMGLNINQMRHSLESHHSHSDTDVDFCNYMIPLHEGGIDLAEMADQHGDDPLILAEAKKTINEHSNYLNFLFDFVNSH